MIDTIVDYTNHNLDNATFRRANLYKAKFKKASLIGIDFREANLNKASLHKAKLMHADIREAKMFNVNLSMADLEEADLSNVNLTEARLFNANLKDVDLSNANLTDAYLKEANLEKADLEDANLTDVNLYKANMKNAKIDEVWIEYIKSQDVYNFDMINWIKKKNINKIKEFDMKEYFNEEDVLKWAKESKFVFAEKIDSNNGKLLQAFFVHNPDVRYEYNILYNSNDNKAKLKKK